MSARSGQAPPSARAGWLVKTEPSTYAFADLVREGRTAWTGVRNALAQQHLRAMRVGDDVLVYHTGSAKAVVGLARVARDPYPDPTAPGTSQVCVDLAPVEPLERPRPLATLKADADLAGFDLLRLPRLSVMPVPAAVWTRLVGRRPSGGLHP